MVLCDSRGKHTGAEKYKTTIIFYVSQNVVYKVLKTQLLFS